MRDNLTALLLAMAYERSQNSHTIYDMVASRRPNTPPPPDVPPDCPADVSAVPQDTAYVQPLPSIGGLPMYRPPSPPGQGTPLPCMPAPLCTDTNPYIPPLLDQTKPCLAVSPEPTPPQPCSAAPVLTKDGCCDDLVSRATANIIGSIALEEAALAHIMNMEGAKIEAAIQHTDSIDKLLEVNASVSNMLKNVTELEKNLLEKLRIAAELARPG
ncbi:MAG: hypothetical protein LBR73_10100 [Oscillospiraceae bacterium]|jgi:hypothetical protein|nr:hypothetical protein [Oscillospiraceae bacterium]